MSQENHTIFVIEDDPIYGKLLSHHLKLNPNYVVHLFEKGLDALNSLHLQPDIICLDFGLPDIAGNVLLNKMLQKKPELDVIIISGQEDIEVAVGLLKAGAKDYIIKNDHARDMLWRSIINLLEKAELKQEISTLKDQLVDKFSFENSIIGESSVMRESFKLLQKACNSSINVSLSGETGTGKEVYAKAIHYNSKRKNNVFVPINMASIPKNLCESELFGHEKGAFTGADQAKMGKFEEASGGTLFLDEITEMDLSLQAKVLRALQEREITRIGGNKKIPIDIRLISATNLNLNDEVAKGQFREDLYYRIIGLPIELPPLRNRGNDILILAKHFVDEFSKANNQPPSTLSNDAKNKLLKYAFPGNVRELKAVVELACVLKRGQEITESDISFYDLGVSPLNFSADRTLKEYTNDVISHFLRINNNNVLKVAKQLQVSKSTIYNLLKDGSISKKPPL